MTVQSCRPTSMYNVGITWGAFDLFHFGHVELLRRAREKCQRLVVCVSTDEYVELKKGRKPVRPWDERLAIVHACRYVDLVGNQGVGYTKAQAVKDFHAEVIFVGSDWANRPWDGNDLGVPVVFLPRTPGISSTGLRQHLQQLQGASRQVEGEVR